LMYCGEGEYGWKCNRRLLNLSHTRFVTNYTFT
jgi:hypothetical protein